MKFILFSPTKQEYRLVKGHKNVIKYLNDHKDEKWEIIRSFASSRNVFERIDPVDSLIFSIVAGIIMLTTTMCVYIWVGWIL